MSEQTHSTEIINVIKTMMWCHGINLKFLKETPELPEQISKVLYAKLQWIQQMTFDDIVSHLAKNGTCCETMGRILTMLRIKSEDKKGTSKTAFSWCKENDIMNNNKKNSMTDNFKMIVRVSQSETVSQSKQYLHKCSHFDYTPGEFKLRDMKRVDDLTKDMDERRYEQLCKARKENSFFNIQPDLKNWLGNKETPKFFLSVLAHDITLQIIDNYLRQVDLAETTFF